MAKRVSLLKSHAMSKIKEKETKTYINRIDQRRQLFIRRLLTTKKALIRVMVLTYILLYSFIIIDLNDQSLNGAKIYSEHSLEGPDQEEESDEEAKSSKNVSK